MADESTWRDYPVCPPCLVGVHTACDGGTYWCECPCGLLPESESRS